MSWCFSLELDESLYPLSVVRRAAYAMAGDCSIQMDRAETKLILGISPVSPTADFTELQAKAQLLRTLNDFVLREVIRQETRGVHELLAKAALHGSGVS